MNPMIISEKVLINRGIYFRILKIKNTNILHDSVLIKDNFAVAKWVLFASSIFIDIVYL